MVSQMQRQGRELAGRTNVSSAVIGDTIDQREACPKTSGFKADLCLVKQGDPDVSDTAV